VFPRTLPRLIRRPVLALACYLPAPLVLGVSRALGPGAPAGTVATAQGVIAAAGLGLLLLLLGAGRSAGADSRDGRAFRGLFWGALLGLGAVLATVFLDGVLPRGGVVALLLRLLTLLFPLAFAPVLLRARVPGGRAFFSGGARYALVSRVGDLGLVIAAIALVARPLYLIGRDGLRAPTLASLFLAVALAVALAAVRRRVGRALGERLFPRVHDARRTLQNLGQAVVTMLDLPLLLKHVVNRVSEAFRLEHAAMLLREGDRFELRSAAGYADNPIGAVAFPAEGTLERLLRQNPHGVRLDLEDPECPNCARLAEAPPELEGLRRLGVRLLMPLRSRRGLAGCLCLGPKPAGDVFTAGEIALLADAAVQIGTAVENAELTREITAREQHRREIVRARELQMSLLPAKELELPGLSLAGQCTSAKEVGGDYFDYFELPHERVAVILGDVCGHGLEAGMMMAVAKSALLTQVAAKPDIPAMLEALHRAMCLSDAQTIFMTAVLVVHDARRGRIQYGIAGHPPPLLLRAGSDEPVALEGGFYPLGIEMDRPYLPDRLAIRADDCLLLYSDGIIEARNPAGESFGLDRLRETFAATQDQSSTTVRDSILAALKRFVGGAPLKDDVTLVAIKFGEVAAPADASPVEPEALGRPVGVCAVPAESEN
jgi:sigma-B regulation protein RsbU (phosphoserine phosphatase)